jgi:hypothetical protein
MQDYASNSNNSAKNIKSVDINSNDEVSSILVAAATPELFLTKSVKDETNENYFL